MSCLGASPEKTKKATQSLSHPTVQLPPLTAPTEEIQTPSTPSYSVLRDPTPVSSPPHQRGGARFQKMYLTCFSALDLNFKTILARDFPPQLLDMSWSMPFLSIESVLCCEW